jgi:AraC-like DNA-binding protein
VHRGSAVLEFAGGAILRVGRHRVTIVPPGLNGPEVLVVRARVRATCPGSVGLFDRLREPLVEGLNPGDPLRRAFRDLFEEIGARRPGARGMAEALLRRCLILLLRRCAPDGRRPSWLAALEDSRLGRAVSAMQERPDHSFTLPGLAEVAGMSRSAFAARFSDALGQSPIGYLKALRLARATRLLLGTDLPVKSVATRVGYSSRSSFTRAFIACHGIGPMAFRAAARELTTDPTGRRPETLESTSAHIRA